MNKYIIKNCGCNPACDECYTRCKDITDCLLKRIVNDCKEQLNGLKIGVYTLNDILANNILKMLDIEEIEQ